MQVTLGASYDDLAEARKGYLNYIGDQLGVEGAVRRDEANPVYDFDQYLQVQWDPAARWRLTAGVRNNAVEVSSHDHLSGNSPPDSSVRYSAVTPVGGVTFRANALANLYASYGKGFETPTLNDLAYRSTDGSQPGLNLALKPAHSDDYEVGIKAGSDHVRANLAGFYIKTVDDWPCSRIRTVGTVDQNIGETTRHGAELGLDADLTVGFTARVAYSYIRAIVAQSYTTCVGTPCRQPSTVGGPLPANYLPVAAGSYLPAVPMNTLYVGVTWKYLPWGFSTTLETQGRSRIYTDDRNSASAGVRIGWPTCGQALSKSPNIGGSASSPALITSRIATMLVR